MFEIIQNFLFGGNTHWVKAAKLADETLNHLSDELSEAYLWQEFTTDSTSRYSNAQHTCAVHAKIENANALWKAFDAISEPTVDDFERLANQLAELTMRSDMPIQLSFNFA